VNLETTYIRAYLTHVTTRIETAANTLDWAHGKQTLNPDHLIPPFPTDPTARAEAARDWERYKRQTQSLGPRILKIKRMGAVGDVNWGGKDPSGIDDKLTRLNLRKLIRTAFDPLAANGITAAMAYQDEGTRENRIQVLGGFLEPIYAEDDPTSDPIGLYQVTQDPGDLRVRYRVRVYDFQERSIREWRALENPTHLDGPPTREWLNTSVPRVAIFDTDQDGYPVGELQQALATLAGEVADQMRIARVADTQAWALLALAGAWDISNELGATSVLISTETGSTASRVEPASLSELFAKHDRTMERLRNDMNLPVGSIGAGAWPSGEALAQANVAYVSSSSDYATILSEFGTDVVRDYATLEGIDPDNAPPVVVSISREQMRATISTQVREDFKVGVIDLRMAVTAISPYYPNTTPEELEAFVTGVPPAGSVDGEKEPLEPEEGDDG
jgi:hypothetical protein